MRYRIVKTVGGFKRAFENIKRVDYFYYDLMPDGTFYNNVSSKPLPTYPRALRFKSFEDMVYYQQAKKSFIQSIKIPDNCFDCPMGVCKGVLHGSYVCRMTWRDTWEFVK